MEAEELKDLVKLSVESNILSKAIIEDYCEVISKLTNISVDEIKIRILKNAEKERIKLSKKF